MALRCAAAVVATLPGVRIRLVHHEQVVLDVRRPGDGDAPPGAPTMRPCGFRAAVARAHAMRSAGERIALRGVEEGEPEVEWVVGPGDLVGVGPLLRTTLHGQWCHVAAVALPSTTCVERLRSATVAGDGARRLGLHDDADLDVTLLHRTCPIGDHAASHEAVADLEQALATIAVAELLDQLATAPS